MLRRMERKKAKPPARQHHPARLPMLPRLEQQDIPLQGVEAARILKSVDLVGQLRRWERPNCSLNCGGRRASFCPSAAVRAPRSTGECRAVSSRPAPWNAFCELHHFRVQQ